MEKKEEWTQLAGGLSNGKVLIVVAESDLIVIPKRHGVPGYDIHTIPFSALRQAGLPIPREDELDK